MSLAGAAPNHCLTRHPNEEERLMSVTSTHSPVAYAHGSPQTVKPRRVDASGTPRWGEPLTETAEVIGAPPIYGPPISFLLGPWLLLVLLLIPPFALLFTVVLVLAVAAGLLVALTALLASPYLLVRRHRAHRALQAKPQASPRPVRGSTDPSPLPI
jgi:hypothetical protein